MIIRIVSATALLCLLCVGRARSEEIDQSKAIGLFEGATDSIASYDLRTKVTESYFLNDEFSGTGRAKRLDHRARRGQPLVKEWHFRQVYQRQKGRIEFLDRQGKPGETIVFDGEIERTWNPKTASSTIRSPTLELLGEGMDYRGSLRNAYGRASLLKCLQERTNVVVKRPEDGTPRIVLETEPQPRTSVDLGPWGFRVTLDPSRGCMPVQIERLVLVDGQLFVKSRRTIQLKNISQGVWAPIQMTTVIFDSLPKLGTFGELEYESRLDVDPSQSSWNQDISNEEFTLALPRGTTVVDNFRSVRYVTGEPDPGKNLDELAAHARQLIPVSIGDPLPAQWWQSFWLRALISVAVVSSLAMVAVKTLRRVKGLNGNES